MWSEYKNPFIFAHTTNLFQNNYVITFIKVVESSDIEE